MVNIAISYQFNWNRLIVKNQMLLVELDFFVNIFFNLLRILCQSLVLGKSNYYLSVNKNFYVFIWKFTYTRDKTFMNISLKYT